MKSARGFSTPFSVAEESFGLAEFWSELRELRDSIPAPRAHFTWDEWDRFWELAQRFGMMDYVPDEEGYAKRFRYGGIGSGLAQQFLRVKEAREAGIDAYRFHLQERKAIEADERRRKDEIERERQIAIARRAREEESRKSKFKSGYTTQVFTPRRGQHDDEIAI